VKTKALLVRIGAVVLATTATFAAAPVMTAGATSVTPGWQPDPNDLGDLQFFDSAGHQITSGSTDAVPMASYYKVPGATAANGWVATTTPEKSNSLTWNGTQQITSTQTFPKPSLPGDLAGYAGPVVADDSAASFQQNQIDAFPNGFTSADPTYQNLYEVRLYVNSDTTKFYAADIMVDGTAHTWTRIYPSATPAPAGTVTLTGTHRVGTVDTCTKSFTDATTYAYKWFAGATQIAGATGSTYRISEKYYKWTLKCEVDATGAGGTTAVRSAGHVVGIGRALIVKTKPYVYRKTAAGKNRTTAKRGVREYDVHGTWSPAATSYRYQWFRGTRRLSGATRSSYVPTRADVGHRISCRVTAIRFAWTSGVFRTASVRVLA